MRQEEDMFVRFIISVLGSLMVGAIGLGVLALVLMVLLFIKALLFGGVGIF